MKSKFGGDLTNVTRTNGSQFPQAFFWLTTLVPCYDDFTLTRFLVDSINPSGDIQFIIFQLVWSPVADNIIRPIFSP